MPIKITLPTFMKFCVFLLPLLLLPSLSQAKEAEPMAANPEMEKKAMAIAEELRCLVCQNQTIAASHAELAIDLKNKVRKMVAEGKTKQEIMDYMVARYGDFVLYDPPVKSTTYALWGGPAVLMVLGVSILLFNLKNRKKVVVDTPLSDEQNKQIDDLLKQEGVSSTQKKTADAEEDNSKKNEGDS